MLQQAYSKDFLPQSTGTTGSLRIPQKLNEGHVLITKQDSLGAPVTAVKEVIINTDADIIQGNHRITVAGMTHMPHISHDSASKILHNHLNM